MNVKRANCATDESMKSTCPKVSTLLLCFGRDLPSIYHVVYANYMYIRLTGVNECG